MDWLYSTPTSLSSKRKGMEFTDIYKQTNSSSKTSPNSAFIASIVLHRIIIRDAESLQIVTLFTGVEAFVSLQWSPDSTLIAAHYQKLDAIQIYRVSQIDWEAKISLGSLGLSQFSWSPDSRHILAISEHNIRLMIWSLVDESVLEIRSPKIFTYRGDKLYIAICTRKESKEWCAVYDIRTWSEVSGFYIDTVDCSKMEWSPDGRYIAVCDHTLRYNLCIYTPDGRLAGRIDNPDLMGIKTLKWSPSSQFLCAGGYNHTLSMYNHLTWKASVKIQHPKKLVDKDIIVYMESENVPNENDSLAVKWSKASNQKMYPPLTISTIKPDYEKPNPRAGVSLIEFSADGRYLLTRSDNMGQCLWMFDMQTLRQKALIHQLTPRHSIKQVKWNPIYIDQFIFLSCPLDEVDRYTDKKSCLYYYRNNELEIIQIPAVKFHVTNIEWNSDGRSIILMNSEKFCVGFPLEESISELNG